MTSNKHKAFRAFAVLAFSLLNILYLIACLNRSAIPGAIFEDIQAGTTLTGAQITNLGSIYVYVYGFAQIFAGILVDRFGGKRTAIWGGVFAGVGLSLFSVAESPALFAVSRIITAIGQSFFYLCIVKITHLLFSPKAFGSLIGISMAIGFFGSIFGTMPTQWASEQIGWRSLFLCIGILALLASVLTASLLFRLHEKHRKTSDITLAAVKHLFNERRRFCFMTFNFFSYPAFVIITTILGQKFIQDYLGFSAARASLFTLSSSITALIACLLGVPALKLMKKNKVSLVFGANLLPLIVSLFLMAGIIFNLPVWCFCLSFLAISFGQISSSATSALLCELMDTKTIAFTAAIRNTLPYVGAGLVGNLCGIILNKFSVPGMETGIIRYPPEAYLWILGVMAFFSMVGLILIAGMFGTAKSKRLD